MTENNPDRNEQQAGAKPVYNGPDRRTQNPDVRKDIGEEKILTEEQRSGLLNRLKEGVFNFRKNKGLRQALGGEEHILEADQRSSTLQAIKEAIQKFFKAGVSKAAEDEVPKKQSFVDKYRSEQKHKETFRWRK